MKKSKISLILAALFFTLLLSGCAMSPEESYTVWTDSVSYSEFESAFGTTLDDGYYVKTELTSAQWKQLSPNLTNDGKHHWSEEKIKDWFVGRGFGNSESTKESAWLTTVDHGFIASRDGNVVYLILK